MDAASPPSHPKLRAVSRLLDPQWLDAQLASLARGRRRPPFWLPLVLLAAATLLLRATNIDLAVSGLFFDPQTGDWPWLQAAPWCWLYDWGGIPGIAVGVGGLAVYLLSFWVGGLRKHRKAGAFLALALVLGPGLLVNGVMKPVWGRPRPCQLARFGGDAHYVPTLEIRHHDRSASFPSGHASIGFALIAPMFLAWRRYRHLARTLLAIGIAFGMAMGLARVVQGGHFVSDVLWSAAVVYFTCWTLGAIMRLYAPPEADADAEGDTPQVFRLQERAGERSPAARRSQKRAA